MRLVGKKREPLRERSPVSALLGEAAKRKKRVKKKKEGVQGCLDREI